MSKEEIIHQICASYPILPEEAQIIVEKAILGQECTVTTLTDWFNNRFLPNCVLIDEDGYTKMCINALKILDRTAATDYGSSRQRDLGQLWADMTRGYLGEYAFKLFLQQNAGLEAQLGHEVGQLQEYLPTDIHSIQTQDGINRPPRLNLSIKTSKWNGIWLDIPGDQFAHSDIHVFVKVGTGRDHLFAFFKHISVFKDKVLKKGQEIGAITPEESTLLFNNLPTFQPILAYICGFVQRDFPYTPLSYSGKKGRKNYTITGWKGQIAPGDLERIKAQENIMGSVKFESIGEFSHDKGYLFNTGNLLWQSSDWQHLFETL